MLSRRPGFGRALAAPLDRWHQMTPTQRSYFYAKLIFFVGTFGFFFIVELYRALYNPY
jgi:hypothetical protein